MTRLALLASAGTVALGALAGLLIWRLGDQPASAPARPVEMQAAPPVPAPALPPEVGAVPAAPAPSQYRDPSRLPRRTPESAPWAEVPLTTRYSALGALAPALRAAVEQAREEMDPCFDLPGAYVSNPGPDARGPAVITLHLESRPGRLEVVDAPLDRAGTSGVALIACCQKVLRQIVILAEGLEPGLRYRYQFVLVR